VVKARVQDLQDVYHNYAFQVSIDTLLIARFNKVSPVEGKSETFRWKEAHLPHINKELAGHVNWSQITFTRGVTQDLKLFFWAFGVLDPRFSLIPPRQSLTISTLDRSGEIQHFVTLLGAYPVGYKIGEWDAQANGVLVEDITVSFENVYEFPGSAKLFADATAIGSAITG
jgi:phage tail-like protein